MELRKAEQEISELCGLYNKIRDHRSSDLPELAVSLLEDEKPSNDSTTATDENNMTATKWLEALESLTSRLEQLQGKIDKFRKRKSEKDPVTDAPRYGAQTLVRVNRIIQAHEALQDVLTNNSTTPQLHQELQQQSRGEQQEQMRIAQQEQQVQEKAAAEARARERQTQLEQERQAQAAKEEAERQRQERARQVQEARQEQERVRQEAERADREWIQSIAVGADGVREQLNKLMESTQHDRKSQSTAIEALHTIFSQIVARPEEPKFRRIRRDHARFTEDVGRHAGGKEVLISAGFVLGAIDDVPSFLSIEPSLEHDMDKWSAWFDLIKKTLEIIEEQMINL